MNTNLSKEELQYIYTEVLNDNGQHGDFLKAFGWAVLRADFENFQVMTPLAQYFVEKYKLTELLPDTKEML